MTSPTRVRTTLPRVGWDAAGNSCLWPLSGLVLQQHTTVLCLFSPFVGTSPLLMSVEMAEFNQQMMWPCCGHPAMDLALITPPTRELARIKTQKRWHLVNQFPALTLSSYSYGDRYRSFLCLAHGDCLGCNSCVLHQRPGQSPRFPPHYGHDAPCLANGTCTRG